MLAEYTLTSSWFHKICKTVDAIDVPTIQRAGSDQPYLYVYKVVHFNLPNC